MVLVVKVTVAIQKIHHLLQRSPTSVTTVAIGVHRKVIYSDTSEHILERSPTNVNTVIIGVPREVIYRHTSERTHERCRTSMITVSLEVPIVHVFRDTSQHMLNRSPTSAIRYAQLYITSDHSLYFKMYQLIFYNYEIVVIQ